MRHSSVGSTEVWNASIQLHGIDTIQLILKLMLGQESEDEIWSRFMFELVIWTQPSGPLCLWQCLNWLDQRRPSASKAWTGSSGQNTDLGCFQCIASRIRRSARCLLRKWSFFVTNRHFSSFTGGPYWAFRYLDDIVEIHNTLIILMGSIVQ